MRIRWTPSAFNDLQQISIHIESQRGVATANRVCRIIYDAVQILRRFPESGRRSVGEGVRELVVAKMPAYLVAYRLRESELVEILRIWHGAQERD